MSAGLMSEVEEEWNSVRRVVKEKHKKWRDSGNVIVRGR